MCEREREREREWVSVCVCEREREREREHNLSQHLKESWFSPSDKNRILRLSIQITFFVSAKEGKWFGNKYYLPPVSRKLNLDHYWRLGDAFIEKKWSPFSSSSFFFCFIGRRWKPLNDNCPLRSCSIDPLKGFFFSTSAEQRKTELLIFFEDDDTKKKMATFEAKFLTGPRQRSPKPRNSMKTVSAAAATVS